CSVLFRILSFPPRAAVAGQELRYQAVVSVAGGATFSLSGPDGAHADESGLVTWTPSAGQAGDQQFTLTASSGAASAAQSFKVNVATLTPASQGSYDPNDPAGASIAVQAP